MVSEGFWENGAAEERGPYGILSPVATWTVFEPTPSLSNGGGGGGGAQVGRGTFEHDIAH